MKQTDN